MGVGCGPHSACLNTLQLHTELVAWRARCVLEEAALAYLHLL